MDRGSRPSPETVPTVQILHDRGSSLTPATVPILHDRQSRVALSLTVPIDLSRHDISRPVAGDGEGSEPSGALGARSQATVKDLNRQARWAPGRRRQ
jgi:hypothetical protein